MSNERRDLPKPADRKKDKPKPPDPTRGAERRDLPRPQHQDPRR